MQSSRAQRLRQRPDRKANGFATRLRSVIDAHGGPSAVARVIARSEGAVRKWLRAESEPNVSDLRAICEATATSIAWLAGGSGERSLPAPAPAAARAEYALLEDLLMRVDAELDKADLVLTSAARSALIVTLYQLFRQTHAIDPQALTRVVRLAQRS